MPASPRSVTSPAASSVRRVTNGGQGTEAGDAPLPFRVVGAARSIAHDICPVMPEVGIVHAEKGTVHQMRHGQAQSGIASVIRSPFGMSGAMR